MSFPNYNKVSHVLATCFGVGSIPFAPGTWGSLFAVLLIYNIAFLQEWIILAAVLTVALSWWVCVEVHKDVQSPIAQKLLLMNLQECLWLACSLIMILFHWSLHFYFFVFLTLLNHGQFHGSIKILKMDQES